jgi:hypothetical protein
MKYFMIRYRRSEGNEADWHQHIADFIAQLDTDPAVKGKISYRCLKRRDGADYFHIAGAVDDEAIKALQGSAFFPRYNEATRGRRGRGHSARDDRGNRISRLSRLQVEKGVEILDRCRRPVGRDRKGVAQVRGIDAREIGEEIRPDIGDDATTKIEELAPARAALDRRAVPDHATRAAKARREQAPIRLEMIEPGITVGDTRVRPILANMGKQRAKLVAPGTGTRPRQRADVATFLVAEMKTDDTVGVDRIDAEATEGNRRRRRCGRCVEVSPIDESRPVTPGNELIDEGAPAGVIFVKLLPRPER